MPVIISTQPSDLNQRLNKIDKTFGDFKAKLSTIARDRDASLKDLNKKADQKKANDILKSLTK